MKILLYIFGLLFIMFGTASFIYHGVSYTAKEKVAEINIPEVAHWQVTETKQKQFEIPPILAGASIAIGLVFIGFAFRMKK